MDAIRHRLYEVEWECGEVISSIVRRREEWHSDLYRSIRFPPTSGTGRNQAVMVWSKDLVRYLFGRVQETLEDAPILARAGRWNACVNRLYYACFYGFQRFLQ